MPVEKVMRTVPAALYGGHAESPLCQSVPRKSGAGVRVDNLGALSISAKNLAYTLPVHTKTATQQQT